MKGEKHLLVPLVRICCTPQVPSDQAWTWLPTTILFTRLVLARHLALQKAFFPCRYLFSCAMLRATSTQHQEYGVKVCLEFCIFHPIEIFIQAHSLYVYYVAFSWNLIYDHERRSPIPQPTK